LAARASSLRNGTDSGTDSGEAADERIREAMTG
jgi:hypothetical protein